jgi:hypothetical protein
MATNLKATGPPLTKGKPAVPSRPASITQIRNWRMPGAETFARDFEGIVNAVNNLQQVTATTNQSIDQIRLTNAAGELVAAIGDFIYKGTQYTNYLSEIHVGDPLQKHDPSHALLNANTDGSVVIGQNGWLDVLDAFGKDAGWLGAQNDTLPVTGADNNGSGLIRLKVPGHSFATNNTARVQGVGGIFQDPPPGFTAVNNATGTWMLTVVDNTYVDLQSSVFVGKYTSGGVIDRVLQIASAANNGSGLIRIETTVPHTYETGESVDIQILPGMPAGEGQWLTLAIDATHFDLAGSTFSGTYTGGGTCLRYFAGMLAQTIAVGPSFANYHLRAFANGDLRIKNAIIDLISAGGEIKLDPSVPTITASKTGVGSIVINASVPDIEMYDAAGNLTIVFDPNGVSTIKGVTNRLLPAGGSTGQVLTKHSGTDYDVDWEAGGGSSSTLHVGYFTISGTLTASSTSADGILPDDATFTPARYIARLRTAPVGSSLTVEIRVNGSVYQMVTFTTGVSLVTSSATGGTIPASAVVYAAVTAVGSSTPGADLSMTFFT